MHCRNGGGYEPSGELHFCDAEYEFAPAEIGALLKKEENMG
jgi:hypothetical protein